MKFNEALNDYTSVFNDGRKAQLEMLLREITTYNYTDFAQLVGAIHTHLDLINEKAMTSEQYEAEANADHITSEQFPNV